MHVSEVIPTAIQAHSTTPMITPNVSTFNWGFETFGEPELSVLFDHVKRFASSMELHEDARWLTILGKSGTGKTHLAACLLAYWRKWAGWTFSVNEDAKASASMRESRFVSFPKLLDRQRDGQYNELQGIAETPFIIIDDLGAEHDPSGFAKGLAYKLAECRLGKWTVITSNLRPEQIAALDARIVSRMRRGGSVIVETKDSLDYNLRKKN